MPVSNPINLAPALAAQKAEILDAVSECEVSVIAEVGENQTENAQHDADIKSDLADLSAAVADVGVGVSGVAVLPKLAPDLTYPSAKSSSSAIDRFISSINISSALTPVLSLSGKWAISRLFMDSLVTSGSLTVKLTVDGVVIWNSTWVHGQSSIALIGQASNSGTAPHQDFTFMCESSFLLEAQLATETSATVTYVARPIL